MAKIAEITEEEPKAAQQEEIPLAVGIVFQAISYSIFFCLLEVAVHTQYSQEISIRNVLTHLLAFLPGLSTAVYITSLPSLETSRLFRLLFTVASAMVGCSTVHVATTMSYTDVMAYAPSLATFWVFTIVKLDLSEALVSLCITAAFVHFGKYTIY